MTLIEFLVHNNKRHVDKEFVNFCQQWLRDLRSGNYTQCQRQLSKPSKRAKRYDYCCLGVACHTEKKVFGTSENLKYKHYLEGKTWRNLALPQYGIPEKLTHVYVLQNDDDNRWGLADLNDSQELNFKQIANVFEINFPAIASQDIIVNGVNLTRIFKFINELRTTTRQQARGVLFDGKDVETCGCCQSGLLFLTQAKERIIFQSERLLFQNNQGHKIYLFANEEVINMLGVDWVVAGVMMDMNDKGKTFAEIADYLEAQVKELCKDVTFTQVATAMQMEVNKNVN